MSTDALLNEQQLNQIKDLVRSNTIDVVKATQKELLQSAANTATKICEANVKASSSQLRDVIDDEVTSKHDDFKFRSNINQSHYEFCREVEQLWRRVDRAVSDGSSTKAKAHIERGKRITKRRMKCLKLAENEGWDTALAFLSDDLASDEEEATRLKNARKDVNAKRERGRRSSPRRVDYRDDFGRQRGYGGYRGQERERNDGYDRYGQNNGFRRGSDEITCWRCGRMGGLGGSD